MVALATIAAACGGSDDDAADAPAPAAAEDAGDAGDSGAEADSGDDGATDDAAADSGDDAGSDAAADDAASGPSGHLKISVSTFPNSLIPPNAAERNAINVMQQIFDGLTHVTPDGEIVPALAESWTISDDGLVYTFQLRDGVTFHDGTSLDCQDVIDTYTIARDPVNAYAYTYETAEPSCGATDLELILTTEEPDPLLLRRLMEVGITSSEQAAQGLAAWEEQMIGAGPFKVVEWVKGERIELAAHEGYWDSQFPKVAQVTVYPMEEESTRIAAVQTGELDIANRLSADQAQVLNSTDGVSLLIYPTDRVYYIAFNNLTSGIGEPTEDVKVRQAMNMAVDRQAIIDALLAGNAQLSNGLITNGNLGWDDTVGYYDYDPDGARALLAEAGYPDGFEIGMACPNGAYTNFEQVCQAVEGYLADVGITMANGGIEFMESGQYWELEAEKQLPPLFGDAWSTNLGEAVNRLQGAVLADASYAAWAEPTITDLVNTIATTVDTDERAALYGELHRYMFENPPFIYLYEPQTFEGVSDRVSGYRPNAAETYHLKYVSVSE